MAKLYNLSDIAELCGLTRQAIAYHKDQGHLGKPFYEGKRTFLYTEVQVEKFRKMLQDSRNLADIATGEASL